MNTDAAPLTAQARYKQILAELAELYERREYLRRGKRAPATPAAEAAQPAQTDQAPTVSPAPRPAMEMIVGGQQQRTADDPVIRQQLKAQFVLIHGGRTD